MGYKSLVELGYLLREKISGQLTGLCVTTVVNLMPLGDTSTDLFPVFV